MLYIIFLQQIHVVHVTVRFILLQLQLQAFYTPALKAPLIGTGLLSKLLFTND